MPSWRRFEAEAPELAQHARRLLDAFAHKTIATLRRDGSPRISGTEAQLRDGELYIGSMWMARKAQDLRRDPRFALHSGSPDPPGWEGDAKVAGRFEEITDPDTVAAVNGTAVPGGRSHLFRADVTEVVVVHLASSRDKLLIDSWHAGRGTRRQER